MDSFLNLQLLEQEVPLSSKLAAIHQAVRARYPDIARIAVASYDEATDLVKTFIYSNDSGEPLNQYERRLAEVPSLQQVLRSGQPRILTHLAPPAEAAGSRHHHYLARQGYRASYTVPLMDGQRCFGFVFFDSREPDPFTPALLDDLATFSHLVMLMVLDAQRKLRTLRGAMHTAHDVMHLRDFETGNHLERMARYARLIAQDCARLQGLSDEFVEHVFLFAPLHDIGKIAVPDSVLLKPGPLSDDERQIMRRHVEQGIQLSRQMIGYLGLDQMPFIDLLYDIIGAHHEAWDGSGYPAGLAGEAIPLAGRIVTVADVFDALSSRRPYKEGWSVERTLDWMTQQSGVLFDPQCVAALVRRQAELPAIQQCFVDQAVRADSPLA